MSENLGGLWNNATPIGAGSAPADDAASLWDKATPIHVGAGETYLNDAVNSVPLGKQATDALSALAMKAFRPSPGAKLTPQAVAQAKQLGIGVPEETAAPSIAEEYRNARADREARTEAGEQQNPDAAMLGKASGIGLGLLAPLPKVAVGSGLAGNLASGAINGGIIGGISGGLGGPADLTKGEYGQAALDALKGAGIGVGVGTAGGLLSAGLSRLAGAAQGKVSAGMAKAAQLAAAEKEKEAGAIAGKLGAETQQGSRLIENILRAESTGDLTPAQSAALKELRASGKWKELVQGVTQRNLDDLPGKLGSIAEKKASMTDFAAGRDAATAARAEEIASPGEAARRLGDQAKRYLPRATGAVAGKVLGSSEGPGLVQGQVLGPMVQALKRTATHPSIQVPAFKALGKVASLATTNPARLGNYAGVVTGALQRGPQAFAATNFVLQQRDPKYAKLVQDIHNEPDPGE